MAELNDPVNADVVLEAYKKRFEGQDVEGPRPGRLNNAMIEQFGTNLSDAGEPLFGKRVRLVELNDKNPWMYFVGLTPFSGHALCDGWLRVCRCHERHPLQSQ